MQDRRFMEDYDNFILVHLYLNVKLPDVPRMIDAICNAAIIEISSMDFEPDFLEHSCF
jgi:hypothetical protein